jgi:hypothetical protein
VSEYHQLTDYYSKNQNAETPNQGQVNNDVRIKHEVAKKHSGSK